MSNLMYNVASKPCVLERVAWGTLTIVGALAVWFVSDDITGHHRTIADMVPYVVVVMGGFFTSMMILLLISTFVECPELVGPSDNTLNRYMSDKDQRIVQQRLALVRRHMYRASSVDDIVDTKAKIDESTHITLEDTRNT